MSTAVLMCIGGPLNGVRTPCNGPRLEHRETLPARAGETVTFVRTSSYIAQIVDGVQALQFTGSVTKRGP